MAKRAGSTSIGKIDRLPADLLFFSRIDMRAQGTRHELRAETDAERRTPQLHLPGQQREFVEDEGIIGVFISTDRAAQHDEKIGKRAAAQNIARAGISIFDRKSGVVQRLFETAEILESDMADGKRGPLRHDLFPAVFSKCADSADALRLARQAARARGPAARRERP